MKSFRILILLAWLVAAKANCSGNAVSCDSYYNDASPCVAIEGCYWSFEASCPSGGCCLGFSKSCDEYSSQTPCQSQAGCTWGDGTSTSGANNCFSGDTTVQVLNPNDEMELIQMKDLHIGDWVLTKDHHFEKMYAFGHIQPEVQADFLQLSIQGMEHPLEITKDHLVFLHGQEHPVPAASLQIGDKIHSTDTKTGAEVMQILPIQKTGLYAPLTASGTLLVGDGALLASNYVHLREEQVESNGAFLTYMSHHTVAHVGTAPWRILCLSSTFSFCLPNEEDGMPTYVERAISLAHWIDQQGSMVQVVAWVLFQGARLVIAPMDALAAYLTSATYVSTTPLREEPAIYWWLLLGASLILMGWMHISQLLVADRWTNKDPSNKKSILDIDV